MNYWIFVVTAHKEHNLTAEEIYRQRMADKFWGLGEKTPNRRSLRKGDQIVYYVGFPKKIFAGCAVLASDCWTLNEDEKQSLSHGQEFYRPEYGVRLEQIQSLNPPITVESVVSLLGFIENKEYWGTYFQGGVRQISEDDFRIITLGTPSTNRPKQVGEEELRGESEFALESHLEEFMDKNWGSIDFGISLARYTTEDQDGANIQPEPGALIFYASTIRAGILWWLN